MLARRLATILLHSLVDNLQVRHAGGFLAKDSPQFDALGTVHSMKRLLNGHSNHQANGSEICKSIEAVDTFWNLQFCKGWSPANSFGGQTGKSNKTAG